MRSELTKRLDDVEQRVLPPRRMVVLWGDTPEPAGLACEPGAITVLRVRWRQDAAAVAS